MKTLTMTFGLFLFAIGCSERHLDFNRFDLNANQKIDNYEFTRGYNKARCFKKWSYASNSVPAQELAQSLLLTTDSDADDHVNKKEFQRTSDYYYFGFVYPSFKKWDRDSNRFLNKDAFLKNAEEAIFEMWDTSGERRLSQHEMSDGIFLSHDKNNNGTLDSLEFSYWLQNRLVIQ